MKLDVLTEHRNNKGVSEYVHTGLWTQCWYSGGRRVEDILIRWQYLIRIHTTKCNSGHIGLEAGVCGEVDKVHKHLIPPKMFSSFAYLPTKNGFLFVRPKHFTVDTCKVSLVKRCPMKPENISVRCDLVGTLLLTLLLLLLLLLLLWSWNITFIFHICLISTSHPHKPYDTPIVNTLKPGQEPQ